MTAPAKLRKVLNRVVTTQLLHRTELSTVGPAQEAQLLNGGAGSKSTTLSMLLLRQQD